MYVENCNARHIDYIVRNVEKINREVASLLDLAKIVMHDENSDLRAECSAGAAAGCLEEVRGDLCDLLLIIEGYQEV